MCLFEWHQISTTINHYGDNYPSFVYWYHSTGAYQLAHQNIMLYQEIYTYKWTTYYQTTDNAALMWNLNQYMYTEQCNSSDYVTDKQQNWIMYIYGQKKNSVWFLSLSVFIYMHTFWIMKTKETKDMWKQKITYQVNML
jgi:hypothetical protein